MKASSFLPTGLYNTYERLLPIDIASSSRIWPVLQDLEHGPGAMSVFVGLDCSAEELDILHKKNAWVFTGNDLDKVLACSLHIYCVCNFGILLRLYDQSFTFFFTKLKITFESFV